MPENRIEWAILASGLVALVVLAALIGLSLGDDPASDAASTTMAVVTETFETPTRAAATAAAATTTTAPSKPKARKAPTAIARQARPKPRPRPKPVRLLLTATRGDSWLEVRNGSATGRVLFSGTLGRGATRTFRGSRLWVRFGGASNLDARLNGRVLALRFGTYDALITPSGLSAPA